MDCQLLVVPRHDRRVCHRPAGAGGRRYPSQTCPALPNANPPLVQRLRPLSTARPQVIVFRIPGQRRDFGRTGFLDGGVEAVGVAVNVIWVVIGQAGMDLAARVLARAISYWLASLSPAGGRARLHVTMRVNRGGGQTESAVQTRLGLDLSASHDVCAGLLIRVPWGEIRGLGGRG
jgi:hypothetical protein